ncbi:MULTISPECIES: hypothetical protein [Shewanella]|uniref:hypothetical protein n=1 Tax=Shewanella TaxID=22 RepID=UPI000B51796A|nr:MULTISPECIES: hypothetical protein [unclassified Shewanella]ASF15767.1 hypothetical protein CEQ32_12795 [Shewanella sp. FDAARGOS_354]QQK61508.1 hypothetical protein FJD32_019730 [Shewanella sp. LC6]TPE56823.1 hypothetical protein FJD33_13430 [Shewanella sp. LC2]
MKKVIRVAIACSLFCGALSCMAADSFSELQSEELSSIFDQAIESAYDAQSVILEQDLPTLTTDIQSRNKRYTGFDINEFCCGDDIVGYNAKAYRIAYTLYFQTAREVWVPLNGKTINQSFWQVVHPKQETYVWTFYQNEH